MSNAKKAVREAFRLVCLRRDGHKCRMCLDSKEPLEVHHVTDRNLMPNGGYVKENGISLCPDCHKKAEIFHSTGTAYPGYAPEDLYRKIGSNEAKARASSEKLG